MDKYKLNFQKLIKWLIPVRKRKPSRLFFLYQGMQWLRDIHDDFISWMPGIRQLALVNNQVINFRDYLRTRFGDDNIDIIHSTINPSLIGRGNDTKYVLGRGSDSGSWIGRAVDPTLTGFTFIVQVPAALVYDSDELRAVINFYKVPGSNYIIQEI